MLHLNNLLVGVTCTDAFSNSQISEIGKKSQIEKVSVYTRTNSVLKKYIFKTVDVIVSGGCELQPCVVMSIISSHMVFV